MSTFWYRAQRDNGQVVQGELQAASEERARLLLESNGLTTLSLRTENEALAVARRWRTGHVGIKDLILFARQASTMLTAGVPIIQTLQTLILQVQKQGMKQLLTDVQHSVEGGDSLSVALAKHTNVFSPFFMGVVRTGEASGRLAESLASIADYLEQDYTFRRKVLAAMLYPALILMTMVIVTFVIFVFVLPQLVQLFADANIPLPLPTRIILAVVTFVQNYWFYLLVFGVVLGFVIRSYLKTREGRFLLSTLVLRLPLISTLFQKVYLARLTSMLHTLFESDVSIIESLELAEQAIGNAVYQRILSDTIKVVKDGGAISSAWTSEPFIPPLLTTMVGIGERSGQVDHAMGEAQRFFKRDVDDILSIITVLLEPIVIILLGIGVAIIVASVFLPIYNLVQTI